MLSKTMVAMAVAGALSCSAGAFAGSGTHHSSSGSDALATEVYVVPAPLAEADESRVWKEEVRSAADKERIATESVYVMTPIEDAIFDPIAALTSAPDVLATLDAAQDGADPSTSG